LWFVPTTLFARWLILKLINLFQIKLHRRIFQGHTFGLVNEAVSVAVVRRGGPSQRWVALPRAFLAPAPLVTRTSALGAACQARPPTGTQRPRQHAVASRPPPHGQRAALKADALIFLLISIKP
jgi:hypothetical protein